METRQRTIHKTYRNVVWLWLIVISLVALPGISAKAQSMERSSYLSMQKELPRLSDAEYIQSEDWPEAPEIEAEAAVLLDADSGEVLYAKNADSKYYPASITKILTALITIEEGDLSDTMVFKGDALTPLPEGYVSIEPTKGEKMLVEDCLYGMLLLSANDAANGLAVYNAKKIKTFAKKMNVRAKEAGATHTHFTNPSGLAEDSHYTTAYDMAMILRACVRYGEFLEIAGSTVHTIPATNKHEARTVEMRHEMLLRDSPNYYEYCVAGKTGFTTPAGRTLVTYAEKDGMRLVCCVMKCVAPEQYKSTRALFDYGFEQFRFIKGEQVDIDRKPLSFSKEILNRMQRDREFTLEKTDSSDLLLPGGRTISDLEVTLQELSPADHDGCFAEAAYHLGGRILGTSRLKFTVRDRSGEALSLWERNQKLQQLRIKTGKTIQMCLAGIVGALLFLLVITILMLRAGKKNRAADSADSDFTENKSGMTENQSKRADLESGLILPDMDMLRANREYSKSAEEDSVSEQLTLPDSDKTEETTQKVWEDSDRKLQESLAQLLGQETGKNIAEEKTEDPVEPCELEKETEENQDPDGKPEKETEENQDPDRKPEKEIEENQDPDGKLQTETQ